MSDQQEEIKMSCSIWQSQSVEVPHISLEFIQQRLKEKNRSLKRERDMLYLVAAGAGVTSMVSIYKHWTVGDRNSMDIVIGASLLLFVLALGCLAVHVRKHIKLSGNAGSAELPGVAVYRTELGRLIKLARREWHVLLYFVPSYLTLLLGGLVSDQRPGKTMRYGLTIAVGVLGACFAFWVGNKKVRCLQRDLDAINSMK